MKSEFVPKKTKTQQLFAERIRIQIEAGKIRPGDHLLPEHELCKHYKLGLRVVRAGLAQLEALGYIGRHRGRGTVVLERSSPKAPLNRGTAAVVIQERVHDTSTTELVDTLQQEFQRHGLGTTLYVTHQEAEMERQIVEQLAEQGVAGMVLFSSHPETQCAHLVAARNRGLKLVLMDHYFPGLDCDSVCIDDEAGGYLAANHLLRLGRRELIYLTTDLDWTSCRLRGKGVEEAVKDFRQDAPYKRVVVSATGTVQLRQALPEAVRGLKGSAGIVAVNDTLASLAIECLSELGWTVPGDIAVVGFNDDLESMTGEVPLTTVEIPRALIGRLAGQLLLDQIHGRRQAPEAIRLAPRLVIRDSCGCYPSPAGKSDLQGASQRPARQTARAAR